VAIVSVSIPTDRQRCLSLLHSTRWYCCPAQTMDKLLTPIALQYAKDVTHEPGIQRTADYHARISSIGGVQSQQISYDDLSPLVYCCATWHSFSTLASLEVIAGRRHQQRCHSRRVARVSSSHLCIRTASRRYRSEAPSASAYARRRRRLSSAGTPMPARMLITVGPSSGARLYF
jgi:hypothetical protein